MRKDDKAFYRAIDLLNLSLEYIYYYSLTKEQTREELTAELNTIIGPLINDIEQYYYFDEDDELIVPEHVDDLRNLMIDLSKSITD